MLIIVAALLFFSHQAYACGGGSSGCCMRSQSSNSNCGGGCQQGYQCGQYGCARRRAFAGLTKRIDGILVAEEEGEQAYTAPINNQLITDVSRMNLTRERLTNPNFIFHTCCESRGLPDACLHHCHFNTYTADKLELMFRKDDACPIKAANEIHYCAAQGIDHRKCCDSNGVADTIAGEKCLAFCDQRPNRFTSLDSSYLPCYDVFENMKKCFFIEIRRRAKSKFGHGMNRHVIPAINSINEF